MFNPLKSNLNYLLVVAVCMGYVACTSTHTNLKKSDNFFMDFENQSTWTAANAQKINQFLARYASQKSTSEKQPVAVFDWDNTFVKNDVGDAFMYSALQNNLILQPPQKNWQLTNLHLTWEAARALNEACDLNVAPGQPLPTQTNTKCRQQIWSIYSDEKTLEGVKAFKDYQSDIMKPGYAWLPQLMAGHTVQDLQKEAHSMAEQFLTAPLGSTLPLGENQKTAGYLRFYQAMVELKQQLEKVGFKVWVLSASPQWLVEVFAAQVGFAPENVIGIRSVVNSVGKITSDLQGCGPIGEAQNQLITYDVGKRCWMNKIIFNQPAWSLAPSDYVKTHPQTAARPAFSAGDSNTDLAFLQDATGLRVVLDRGKEPLMSIARKNEDGLWLIQKPFIE